MMFSKVKNNNRPISEADVDKLYQRPVSITDWLPWVDYDEESETFTLEDGFSAAAMFEIAGVSTEARSAAFLQEVQTNIQTCINHTLPAQDNPFVLQCFVADEDSLSALSSSLQKYADARGRETPEHQRLAKHFIGRMQTHFKRLASNQGVFCLLYTSPSPRDRQKSRMPSSA